MSRNRRLAAWALFVLAGIVPELALAQNTVRGSQFRGSQSNRFSLDPVTIVGIIQKSDFAHTSEAHRAFHVLLSTSRGEINANLGPYLPDEVSLVLTTGQQIEVAGFMRTSNGQNYFLVQKLTIGSRQITIRNANGFLIQPLLSSVSNHKHGAK